MPPGKLKTRKFMVIAQDLLVAFAKMQNFGKKIFILKFKIYLPTQVKQTKNNIQSFKLICYYDLRKIHPQG